MNRNFDMLMLAERETLNIEDWPGFKEKTAL
jgi:hypothetical protein